MASVYQKRGTWCARVRDGSGAWRSHATATTRTHAKRLAQDMERRAERQRFGLDPPPSQSTQTLGRLCEWWLDERCPAPSRLSEDAVAALQAHRHLRGPYVFCEPDGKRLSQDRVSTVVPRTCARAGLAKRLTTHDLLGVCRATVYRLCAEGSLGHVRVLNTTRVPKSELARLLAQSGSGDL